MRTAPREGLDFIKPEGLSGSGLQVKVLYKNMQRTPGMQSAQQPAGHARGLWGPALRHGARAPASAGSGFRGNSGEPFLPSATLLP